GHVTGVQTCALPICTGIPAVVDMAHRMGLTCLGPLPCVDQSPDNYGPSLTLGAYPVRLADMATAASTLATLGVRHREAPILNIKDRKSTRLNSSHVA